VPAHELLKIDYLLGSVLVGAGGIIAGLVGGVLSSWLQRKNERTKERALRGVRILRPLRDRAKDFAQRLRELTAKREEQVQREMFARIKDPHLGLLDYVSWCNGEGSYWAESVLIAARYYQCATWTRDELRTNVTTSAENALLVVVERVRETHGGRYRVWQSAQDAIGHRMGTAGQAAVDEQQFWESIAGREPWLQRLADFFKDLHMKNRDELENMSASLEEVSRAAHALD